MGKEITKVLLINKNEIRLDEDAKAGDYILLSNIHNIDTSEIEKRIDEAKDDVYQKKLNEALKKQKEETEKLLGAEIKNKELEFEKKIQDLNNQISNFENQKKLAISDALKEKEEEIQNLNNTIASFDAKKALAISDALREKEVEIQSLKGTIDGFDAKKALAINEALKIKEEELQKQFKKELEQKESDYKNLNDEFEKLRDFKVRMSNKEVGEDLEKYCSELVNNLMQIGFDNCTWEKDNTSIKEDGESRGTKADFIFKIYLDENHTGEPLSSICLEMKNELLESENKKKNSDHYQKLDKDRNKKGCKYAVLVSNLENDNENILPIYRVKEYPDMYAVRPSYLTTILTIITSLTMRFKDVIVANTNQKLNLAAQTEFISEFDSLKNTYLDKPLASLEKEVSAIRSSNENIQKAVTAINKSCDAIVEKYMNEIANKLDKYYKGVIKTYKKYGDKLDIE